MHSKHHSVPRSGKANSNGKNHLDLIKRMRQAQAKRPAHKAPAAPTPSVNIAPRRTRKKASQHKPNAAFAPLTTMISIICSLDRTQLIGLVFLLSISSAYVIDAANTAKAIDKSKEENPKIPKEKARIKKQVTTEVCADTSKETFNKPHYPVGIYHGAGIYNGMVVPLSCLTSNVQVCKKDIETQNRFKPEIKKHEKQR